ncbi:MAG: hypothetical protein WCJ35_28510 [Planctomycetota bacterium]
MHLIINTHSSNDHYNGDCDCAIIELTPALAEQIRSRVALARKARQQDNDLYELYFWGSTAEFYGQDVLDTCQEAVAAAARGRGRNRAVRKWLAELEQREYAVVPDGVDFSAHEPQRTELDQMILRVGPSSHRLEYAVAWTTSPKHSDVYVTTSELPIAVMDELLAETVQQSKRQSRPSKTSVISNP